MKRITIYIAHLLVLVLTGCDKTVLEFPENEGVDPTLVNANLSLAIDPKIEPYEQTGRSEGEVIDAYDVRWIVEVFRDEIGGELAERRVLGCEPAADGHHTIHTSLALHAARYHVVAWMDYVDNGSVDDKYYTIPSLSSISVPAAGNYIGDEDHKDTLRCPAGDRPQGPSRPLERNCRCDCNAPAPDGQDRVHRYRHRQVS